MHGLIGWQEVFAGSRYATLDKQGTGRASKRRLASTMKYSAEGLGQAEGGPPEGGWEAGRWRWWWRWYLVQRQGNDIVNVSVSSPLQRKHCAGMPIRDEIRKDFAKLHSIFVHWLGNIFTF